MSTTVTPAPAIDEARLEQVVGRHVSDAAAAVGAALVVVGDRLGLWRAMADGAPVTPAALAARTGTHERYVREWLAAQAAGGIVTHDADAGAYALPPEQAFVLAGGPGPFDLSGLFRAATAAADARARVADRFRDGGGIGWHEHGDDLFCGTERVFGGTYRAMLVSEWLPALDGVADRLRAGGRVADVGCGHGVSTVLMAEAFPASRFTGYDLHARSVERARALARDRGVADRVRFEVAAADALPGRDLDLVCFLDALHDMGDPVAAARRARAALRPDGTCMLVEPFAGDRLEDNLNPVGRLYYGMSTLVCTPGSLSQPGRAALGTQAGEARLREVLTAAGFGSVRRVAATPFNLVLEARP